MPTATARRRITADDIRAHAVARYLAPARAAGHATFTIRIGDIMRHLPGIMGVNAPCSALRSERKFQRPNHIKLVRDEGPPSGMGYNTTLTFEFLPPVTDAVDANADASAEEKRSSRSAPTPTTPAPAHTAAQLDLLRGMYGVAGDAYEPLGGGAAVLEKVREGWS